MGIVRDLYYARKMSAGLKLPAPTVALLIKRLRLAAAMGGGVEKTVSGSPAHITDALAKAALSVLASIEPIQDLHGYSHPWPAGGGKNKLVLTASDIKALNNLTWTNNAATSNGITFTILEDAAGNVTGIQANGTASALVQITISKTDISQGGYYLSDEYYSKTAFIRGVFRDANGVAVSIGGSVFTDLTIGEAYREVPSNVSYINIYININSGTTVNNVIFKPMLRYSTESGTYAPSRNICPISGRTGLSVYRTGKNLFNKNATDLYAAHALNPSTDVIYSAGSYTVTGFIKCKAGEKYITSGTGGSNDVCFYDANKSRLSGSSDFNAARTAPNNAEWLRFDYKTANADTVQLEQAATATAYEAFGNTYAVDWTSEAGTVYGGTLDVVTGVLTVDKAMVDLGTLNWTYDASVPRFYTTGITDIKDVANNDDVVNAVSSIYFATGLNNLFSTKQDGSMALSTGRALSVVNKAYTSSADFKYAMSGVQLCYPLATPLTYQLTPQEVQMLLGENYVWSSSGDTVSVTYYAEGNANDLQSLNILLGGRYSNPKTVDDVSDKEALEIILGGNK